MTEQQRLYNTWLEVDSDWHNALINAYGEHSAREKRFDPKYNAATEELKTLRQRFIDAGIRYRAYVLVKGSNV